MNQDSRYIIGIDLGTTNCVVSFIDKEQSMEQPAVELFKVLQVTEPKYKPLSRGDAEDAEKAPVKTSNL